MTMLLAQELHMYQVALLEHCSKSHVSQRLDNETKFLGGQGFVIRGYSGKGSHLQHFMPPPASVVEMPGYIMPQLDVQFGFDFETEPQFNFNSGGGDSNSAKVSYPISPPTSHLSKTIMPSSDISGQSSVLSSPSEQKQSSSLSIMEASPARPSIFPNLIYTIPLKYNPKFQNSFHFQYP